MAAITVQKIPYGGWDNCVQVTNGIVELIVTADVGPRIIHYGFAGRENELCEIQSEKGATGGDEWRIYGGHRLWHSPEARPRTYEPDNGPVAWERIPDGIMTEQDQEKSTGIKKEMEITLSPESSEIRIIHRLINRGLWPVELSVWSITAMAQGGMEVIPLSGKDTVLLPNRVVALWPYTRLNDPRVCFGEKYININQDPDNRLPFKIGIANEAGWAAYFNHYRLFMKYYSHIQNARYPDFGVSFETYNIDFMLEMETLSPLSRIEPDNYIEHKESWDLLDNIPVPDDEAGIDEILQPIVSGKSI
jgi:hypothetical protein